MLIIQHIQQIKQAFSQFWFQIIIVQYWNPKNAFISNVNGIGTHYDSNSYVTKTEEHEADTQEDKENVFKMIYHRNNSLRYCNGSYWLFVDKVIENEYRTSFMKEYNTISNYYGNGVVD